MPLPFSEWLRPMVLSIQWRRAKRGAIFIFHIHMLTQLFISACAVAGFAVIWRNWLAQHKKAELFLKEQLRGFSRVLTCGSCFTYWLALAMTLVHDPVPSFAWTVFPREGIFYDAPRVLISWMALAYVSVLLRFAYVLIQEKVSTLVHAHEKSHSH